MVAYLQNIMFFSQDVALPPMTSVFIKERPGVLAAREDSGLRSPAGVRGQPGTTSRGILASAWRGTFCGSNWLVGSEDVASHHWGLPGAPLA